MLRDSDGLALLEVISAGLLLRIDVEGQKVLTDSKCIFKVYSYEYIHLVASFCDGLAKMVYN